MFEVASLLGEVGSAGLSGEDTRLKRDVALKILPEAFAADPDRVARFQREAELLATLNHPNIAGIYGVEQAHGVRALVLELVGGPTLADPHWPRSDREQGHLKSAPVLCLGRRHSLIQRLVQGLVLRAARHAGLTNVGVHVLRHTFCGHLAMRGAAARGFKR